MQTNRSSGLAGSIAQIVRYPVKSMRGESLPSARLTPAGLEGDRLYAFESEAAPAGMLRVSGRERRELLRFTASRTPAGVVVSASSGKTFAIDDPALIESFPGFSPTHLVQTSEPQTDCRPLSLISLQTISLLGEETGIPLDPRRFRANLYLNLSTAFEEDALVGKTVQIGPVVRVRILERDPRCRFIILDPETTEPSPEIMTVLHRHHQGRAGVYASIVTPGEVRVEDSICIVSP